MSVEQEVESQIPNQLLALPSSASLFPEIFISMEEGEELGLVPQPEEPPPLSINHVAEAQNIQVRWNHYRHMKERGLRDFLHAD